MTQRVRTVVSIEQSAKMLLYFNYSQITRMKIANNQLALTKSTQADWLSVVKEVLSPFQVNL